MQTFDQTVNDNLMAIVSVYRRATGKSLTQVSKEFYGRGDFFEKFARGDHSISTKRLSEMLEKLRKEWPADTRWPLTRPVFMTQAPK